jgi:hypothetical protein
LTQDFQSDIDKPRIFIDLITDQTITTNYMRMNTELAIRENLENNVLGKFKAYGKRIEAVRIFLFFLNIDFNDCLLDQYNSPSYS